MDIVKRPERSFLEESFNVTGWEALAPYFEALEVREINTVDELRGWFRDRSELESVVSEDLAWRYIKMTCDTDNKALTDRYQEFVEKIQPNISPVSNRLNQKAISCPFLSQLEQEQGFDLMVREMKKDIEIFREENIPLFTEAQTLSSQYGQISGAMTIEHGGKELTLQQAAVMLQSTDRVLREEIYRKISARRIQDKESLDELFSKLITLRHQIARNAGFDNFRDYMFKAMGRFDYSPADCFDFHDSVSSEVVPLLHDLADERKLQLGVEQLRPWDKAVDTSGKEALKPFNGGEDLLAKTIECFNRLDPFLGNCLTTMKNMGHLDLVSRKGKAPGGYNYPLAEIGVPFIFMNATSTLRDMVTILHEGGHAVHSFLTKDLELSDFKSTPSEVAELASMAMELISMDHWDVFFADEEALKRAKKEHLEQIIETLPWVATIDKYQHWLYENPGHTVEERNKTWEKIFADFADTTTDWSGLEENRKYLWHKQLHLYEVPFYYIEYGMAQLGAVAVWKNFKENPEKGLEGYLNALKLGYMKSIPEIYKAANIRFDFSKEYITALMGFVREELRSL
ncbi:MAG: M3 family oligoendopeptidase [Cyclobacteriaceae bacterium]|nr:M3 family oligoendopeptidase [Cyclobacteriaceae bacterium]